MQTFKPTGTELDELRAAATSLKAANESLARAKKASDAAKAALAKWLKEQRNLELSTLTIGEIIQIESVAMIEIGVMHKFDQDGFSLAEPDIYGRWVKPLAVKKFKPLV